MAKTPNNDLRPANDKKFVGHTDNTKVALLPGLLNAKKLYKIGKTVIDKTLKKEKPFDKSKTMKDKLQEKLLKSDIMKDVGKKVKDQFPQLKQSIDKQLKLIDEYKGVVKEKVKAFKESKKIKKKN